MRANARCGSIAFSFGNGTGFKVTGTGNTLDTNNEIKDNSGDGVVISGSLNVVKKLTVKGTIELTERLKGDDVGLAFLVELLSLKGRDRLDGRRVTSVIQY